MCLYPADRERDVSKINHHSQGMISFEPASVEADKLPLSLQQSRLFLELAQRRRTNEERRQLADRVSSTAVVDPMGGDH